MQNDEIFYWASGSAKNIEVDFLLKRNNELTAIEVKTSKRLKKEDMKGLNAIAELRGVKKRILVYLGLQKMNVDGIDVMPFDHFCKSFLTV